MKDKGLNVCNCMKVVNAAAMKSPTKQGFTNMLSVCQNWMKPGTVTSYWSKKTPAAPNNAGELISAFAGGKLGECKVQGVGVLSSVIVDKDSKENVTEADEDKPEIVDQSDQLRDETAESATADKRIKLDDAQVQDVVDDQEDNDNTNSDGDDLNVTLGLADSPDTGSAAYDSIDGATPSKRMKLDPSYSTKTEQIMISENESPNSPMQSLIKIESEDEVMIIQEKSFSSRRIKYFPPRAVYDCDVCCFSKFKTENERIQHLMEQAQHTSWVCETCSESFNRPMELHRHKISFHQSRKRTIRSRLIELV